MADFTAIAATGNSLQRFLMHAFAQQQPLSGSATTVSLVRTEDLDFGEDLTITPPALSIFLYRIDFNKTTRASWASIASAKGRSFLPLDLHFLLIPWGANADEEYRILGRTLQSFEDHPVLSGPYLDPTTNWSLNENVQVCLEELSTEDLMRIFDSLPIDYKICLPYLVRILVLEGRRVEQTPEAATLAAAYETVPSRG